MGVVLDGKVGWRWEVGGGITSLCFTYFLSFKKTIQFLFQLSTGLGPQPHFQCPKEETP